MNAGVSLFKDYYSLGIMGAAIVCAIFVTISQLSSKKKKAEGDKAASTSQEANGSNRNVIQGNNNTVNYAAPPNEHASSGGDVGKSNASLKDEIKSSKKVLFIDDNPYPITKLMEKNGWRYVKLVPEIDSFTCDDVINADIILVDVIGVGKNLGFTDQGYELAEALKEYHPNKKIVIYSQEKNKFHKAIKKVDLTIEKTSNIYLLEKEILTLFGVSL